MLKLTDDIKRQLHSDRTISFRYDLLDFNNNRIGELTSKGGSISFNSLAEIKRSGNFIILDEDYKHVDWINSRIQPVMILNNEHEFPLGVFLINSPSKKIINGVIHREIEAYDASLILVEDKFENRFIVPKGANYVTAITQILNSAGILNVNIQNSDLVLNTAREWEIGTPKLEVVNQLLSEMNYTSLWVDEVGYFRADPYILPTFRDVEYEYRNNEISIIKRNTSEEEIDLFSVPNKFIVVATNPETDEAMVARYTNDNVDSPTSTLSRRRSIVDHRFINDIPNQATLEEYVRRIAYEATNVFGKFYFQTALMPHHSYSDCLYIVHDELDVEDKFIETGWDMELVAGGSMTHNCRRVINI